jgi:alkylation response protein AidB-like acyl-CoA dehydrogenase
LRLPVSYGGIDASIPELFALLIELGAADSNLPNIFRSHFGFCEEVLSSEDCQWKSSWLTKLAAGGIAGSGFAEVSNNQVGSHTTKLTMKGNIGHITGRKYYTSGSLFADWINIGAELESGERVTVTIPTHTDGVEIIDDWDGFGQQLSASGTTVLRDAVVYPADVKPKSPRFLYSAAFFQLVHLATLAGVSCRASTDAKELLRQKIRVYGGQSISDLPREDPLLLQVVGRVHSLAYVSCCAVLGAARAVQHAFDEHDIPDRVVYESILAKCDIEVSQCVTVVTDLVFEATTICFDALGASATKRTTNLDRHWRNARTIASHNPRVFHDHAVGDFYVNGRKSPPRTGAGIAKAKIDGKSQSFPPSSRL